MECLQLEWRWLTAIQQALAQGQASGKNANGKMSDLDQKSFEDKSKVGTTM
jgi:hypothetical protein